MMFKLNCENIEKEFWIGSNYQISSLAYLSLCILELFEADAYTLNINNNTYSWDNRILFDKLKDSNLTINEKITIMIGDKVITLTYLKDDNKNKFSCDSTSKYCPNSIDYNSYLFIMYWDLRFKYQRKMMDNNKISS